MEKNERKEKRQRIAWELILPHGEKNAISAEELTRRLGLRDKRSTRAAVSAARLEGVPVCSLQRSEKAHGGYFLPDVTKMEEVEHAAAELRKRAYTSLMQVKMLNRWIVEHNGREFVNTQVTIEDFLRDQGKE